MTLLAPGLLGPWQGAAAEAASAGLDLPRLAVLLSRSRSESDGPRDDEPPSLLFRYLGPTAAAGEEWPVAAFTYGLDTGAAPAGWVMRADPVHLRAGLDAARLLDTEEFSISRAEADELVRAVNHELAGEGIRVEAPHRQRWYIRRETAPRLRTHPPDRVLGGDVRELLPAGAEGARWRRVMSMIQIALHASPVNAARAGRGELPVNSVWLWGGGRALVLPPAPWDRVWSDDPLARGLALAVRARCEKLPRDGRSWLAAAGAGDHLVLLDAGHRQARRSDVEGWRARLQWLESTWFGPLAEALEGGAVTGLRLVAGAGPTHCVTGRMLRRWRWRWRRRPYSTFMTRA